MSTALSCFDDAIEALTFVGETDEVLEVMQRIRGSMGASHALLPALRAVLRERYASIDLAGAAEHLGVSTRSLQRVLTAAHTGFAAELRRARLAAAEHLLCTTSLKISAIARSVGYTSDAHFCRAFKAAHAVEPSVWRAAKLAG